MKKDTPLLIEQNKLIFNESMRELGAARFVLGGVILFFAVFFIWIEIYIVGIFIAICCLFIMEHCSKIIIDKETMLLIKKSGLFIPFLTTTKKSIIDAKSLVIKIITTRHKGFGQKMSSRSTSYKLFFELPDKEILINTFTEKGKAKKFTDEISKLLNLNCSGQK
jgi:hypothetical protein